MKSLKKNPLFRILLLMFLSLSLINKFGEIGHLSIQENSPFGHSFATGYYYYGFLSGFWFLTALVIYSSYRIFKPATY